MCYLDILVFLKKIYLFLKNLVCKILGGPAGYNQKT